MSSKQYEAPSARQHRLRAQEELLRTPTVSGNGTGFDDNGPSDYNPDARRADGE